MINNKPKKGQVLVYTENYNQEAVYPEKLKVKNEELGQIVLDLKSKTKAQDKIILDLMQKNRMIFEILLVLIEQANLNLTQQQLLVLKNKVGGKENV